MLRVLLVLSFWAASATCWPHFWTDPSTAVEGGPMPEKVPGCLEHPDKAYGTHADIYKDPRVTYTLLYSGKPTTRLCPGGTYAIQMSFADDDRRFALLTASQGTLQKSYRDSLCPGRVSLDRHTAKNMGVTSLFNKFAVNLTLPCNSSGPLEIRSTSSNLAEDTFNQASVTFTIDPTCRVQRSACSAPPAPPPPPPPAPARVSTFPKEMCDVPQEPNLKCRSSPLGYSCWASLQLLAMHWTVGGCPPENPCTRAYLQRTGGIDNGQRMLHFALQANTSGYMAVAFARSTHSMVGSDAVLGWVRGSAEEEDMVEAFKISRYSLSFSDAYTDSFQWLLYSSIIREGGQTTLCFTRPLSTHSATHSPALSPGLPLKMLYAVGQDNSRSFTLHKDEGGFTLDLVTGGVSMVSRDWVVEIHGILMVAAWVVLAPLGVLGSRRREVLQGRKVLGADAWFQVHRTALVGAVALFGCSLALGLVELAGGNGTELKSAHKVLGIALAVAVALQVVLGVLRPAPAHWLRKAWRKAHMLLGCSSVLLALVNVGIGLKLYQRKTGRSVVPFAVPVGVVLGAWVVVDLWLVARARSRAGVHVGAGHDGKGGRKACEIVDVSVKEVDVA